MDRSCSVGASLASHQQHVETHLTLLDSTGEEVGDGSEADLLLPLERDLSGIEVFDLRMGGAKLLVCVFILS